MKVKSLVSIIVATFSINVYASGDHSHGHDNIKTQQQHVFSSGQPGKLSEVDRTIKVVAMDNMRYDQDKIKVNEGETIRFIVTNKGKLLHEFSIGDAKEQIKHANMMKEMPNMQHKDPNAISLSSNETGEVIWKFSKSKDIQIACHVAGHYEAGMKMDVLVSE